MLSMLIGPTRMSANVLASIGVQAAAIDDPGFLRVFRGCLEGVRRVHGQTPGGGTAIIPGTGTAGMEALAQSFVPRTAKAAVIITGNWGRRWGEICQRIGGSVHEIVVPHDRPVDIEALSRAIEAVPGSVVFATHVDSSTGLILDLEPVAEAVRRSDGLFLVDAICSAAAEPLYQSTWGVDVVLSSTPKAIGAPAGLFMVTANARARRALGRRRWTPPGFALDLGPWLEASAALEEGEFRYHQSPAGNLIAALGTALWEIEEEGLGARWQRHLHLSRRLHRGLDELG